MSNSKMTANPVFSTTTKTPIALTTTATTPLVINTSCNNVFHLGVVYEGKFLDMLELSESFMPINDNSPEKKQIFNYINELSKATNDINDINTFNRIKQQELNGFDKAKLKDALKSIIYCSLKALEYKDLGADVLFTCTPPIVPIVKGGSQKKNRKFNKHKSTRKSKK